MMTSESKDLSKPFFRILQNNEKWFEFESNRPNDELGDFATEWWTKEQWNEWNAYLAELDSEGTRGDLVYTHSRWAKNPILDAPSKINSDYPLDSYELKIIDISNECTRL